MLLKSHKDQAFLKGGGDVAYLFSDTPHIERDADGVPTAFRVFRQGIVELTQDGRGIKGDLTQADLDSVMNYHLAKGNEIPIDCEHFLASLATKLGIEEADLIKTNPLLGEKACAGFCRLQYRGNEIWASITRWSDRARRLLSRAADELYMYFSPMLRGLINPPFRITSITLTNEPAMNRMDNFAMADRPILATFVQQQTKKENTVMKNIIQKLARLLNRDEAAFTAEGQSIEPLLEATASHIETMQTSQATFLSTVKDAIGLTDGQGLDVAAGLVLSLKEKNKADDVALTDLRSRVTAMESVEKDRLVEKLEAEGRLTPALKESPWFKGLDYAALKDWSAAAPVIVATERITRQEVKTGGSKMTEAQKAIADRCGVSHEAFAKTNGLTL